MCKANGRLFADYARLARTQEYLTALAAVVTPVAGNPITASSLICTIQGGTPALQGTWIHPRLAVDLARWISPAFAVWMDGWFLESLNRPQQPQQHTLPLTPGIHVVASNPRQANWLWGLAVEQHVSSALMTQIAADNSRRSQPSYQLHLLP
ncbi:MAG: KilA-N domain-containing protein, partial [Cyanobacteriota bacterium]|nr:KilA-N domain-containing protein [Cyanobacteriota bacterium]